MANLITLSRILLIAPFAAMFFVGTGWALTAALAIFLLAAATDFLDGQIARMRGETSVLGAALDPLADKLLIAAAILLLVSAGVIAGVHLVAALAILLREILVGGLREALGRQGDTLPVTTLAKWKTTAQLVAVGVYLAAAPGGLIGAAATPYAAGLFWLATLLTLWTGADYGARAVALLRAQR